MHVLPSASSRPIPDDLESFGWSADVASAYQTCAAPGRAPGRVLRVDRGACLAVVRDAGIVSCRSAPPSPDWPGPPATGDWVAVEEVQGSGHRLAAIVPRKSALRRAGRHGELEVIAANVDTVLVLHALDRPTKLRRIERTLVAVWDGGAEPVIVLTKADLVSPGGVAAAVQSIRRVAGGIPVVATSNVTGEGLEGVQLVAISGATLALVGESGAGKSTLVNRLSGEDRQATAATRAGDGKGRHTTTARELIPLASGAVLVDTPGLRSLALWEGERGRAAAFAEVEDLAGQCRFRDCRHDTEPGCAVGAAVADGRLAEARFASYRKLGREQEAQARRARARRRRAESRAGRSRYRRDRDRGWD